MYKYIPYIITIKFTTQVASKSKNWFNIVGIPVGGIGAVIPRGPYVL